jgi:phosphoglycerate dehydrogenase-like enzyme
MLAERIGSRPADFEEWGARSDQSMSKITLLVISPPDERALRGLEALRGTSEVLISNDQAELESLAARADVILLSGMSTPGIDLDRVWRHARSVRWVHSLTTGVEKILFPALVASTVPLTNARGVFKRSLAEFAVLGILFHTKRVRRLIENQRQRKWDSFEVGFANNLVMGVLGYGEIGRECALLAKAIGLSIHALRRNPGSSPDPLIDRTFPPHELAGMLAGIDVLLCAAPLTSQTHHMIGEREFAAMKSTALVINVGRGAVIDEAALIRALQRGTIAGAALDVFEHEPLPEGSPLWSMDNVLISPHCTDQTRNPDWWELSMQLFIENFHRWQSGETLKNIVDKQAGY